MNPEIKLGMNRTGRDIAPLLAKEMLNGTEELTLPRCPEGDAEAIGDNRASYMASPANVGSVPVPATMRGALTTGMQALAGNHPVLLVDKLGERLAFERTGVRLYEALISKFKAQRDMLEPIVSFEKLEEIRSDELSHFTLLADVMLDMGCDPTAMTPSADVTAVNSMGLVKTLGEPRIGFTESLEAILIAELADNDGWDLLIELVAQAGLDDVEMQFREAQLAEREHLATVRSWIRRLKLGTSAETSSMEAA